MKPRICILKTDGTNCDAETVYACQKAGGDPSIISINQLKKSGSSLNDFQILIIPGGFSYGDDIASGKIFALELASFFKEQLEQFVAQEKLILGICNGFQVLVQMGLLPFGTIDNKQVTLMRNSSAKFECRWITMIVEKSPCIFTQHLENTEITLPVNHGEGQLFTSMQMLSNLELMNLVPLRYSNDGKDTMEYPHNPNGSLHAIAGICDPTGKIFGLMPHPERYINVHHYPNWRRHKMICPYGLSLFENAIAYVK